MSAERASYSDRIRQTPGLHADEPALQWGGDWWTWTQLGAGMASLRAAVDAAGLSQSLAAALVLRNRPAGIAALLSLLGAERSVALVSPIQPPAAMARDVARLRPALVVAESMDWTPDLIEAAAAAGAAAVELQTQGQALRAVLRSEPGGSGAFVDHLAGGDAAIIIPTSGTTGPPKRIPFAWSRLDAMAAREASEAARKPPKTVIIAAPLVTITGLRPLLIWAARPMRVALMERLDVEAWARLVHEHKPKIAGLPPAAMRMMLEAAVPAEHLASLEGWHTGSAPLDPAVAEAFEARFKVPVLSAYGATEFGGPVAGWSAEDKRRYALAKRGSTGRFYPGCEGRVVDAETGARLPAGAEGLLEVKAPAALVTGPDGWIRTNDLVRIDEDGFLFILGRSDDVLIRGGFKVPLFEVEAALEEHPAVRQAAGVGLAVERLGQIPAAAVVLEAGRDAMTEAQLIGWVRERLAPYKAPVLIAIMDELPMNASLKIARPILRDQLAAAWARRGQGRHATDAAT
jgi:acyl-coenzyme A synthetase/AMP-(fatty) acid ligase